MEKVIERKIWSRNKAVDSKSEVTPYEVSLWKHRREAQDKFLKHLSILVIDWAMGENYASGIIVLLVTLLSKIDFLSFILLQVLLIL